MPLLQTIGPCCLSSKSREAVTEETTSFGGTNSALISGPRFPPAAPLPALHGPEALRHCLTTVLPIVLLVLPLPVRVAAVHHMVLYGTRAVNLSGDWRTVSVEEWRRWHATACAPQSVV